jgi:hypothetical protein
LLRFFHRTIFLQIHFHIAAVFYDFCENFSPEKRLCGGNSNENAVGNSGNSFVFVENELRRSFESSSSTTFTHSLGFPSASKETIKHAKREVEGSLNARPQLETDLGVIFRLFTSDRKPQKTIRIMRLKFQTLAEAY